jgi:hypothetical protein
MRCGVNGTKKCAFLIQWVFSYGVLEGYYLMGRVLVDFIVSL